MLGADWPVLADSAWISAKRSVVARRLARSSGVLS